jgi:hypothetical protein
MVSQAGAPFDEKGIFKVFLRLSKMVGIPQLREAVPTVCPTMRRARAVAP